MEGNLEAQGKLRNMTGLYLTCGDQILLLYRQGSRVVNNLWVASAGGHFESSELNDARTCVLRELREELGLTEDTLTDLRLRYATLRRMEGELKWFPMEEISVLKMPFTAGFVLEHYLAVGRRTAALYGGVADGEKVVFTEM